MGRWKLHLSVAFLILASAPSASAAGREFVKVRFGDTLHNIAIRHRTTTAELLRLNQLKTTTIHVGQQLRVRKSPPAKAARPTSRTKSTPVRAVTPSKVRSNPTTVTVKSGDTLSLIATRHKLSVRQLQHLNGLKDTRILVGQRLRLTKPAQSMPSVRLTRARILGVPVALVDVDLRNPRILVTPVLPRLGLGFGAKLQTLAQQPGATAVINGGYFHPSSFIPAGDLVIQGRYVSTGRVPTAITITPGNHVEIRPVKAVRPASWRGYETVIASGPHVLVAGKVASEYRAGYRDRAVFGRAARSALGIRSDQRLIFMSTHAQLTPSEVAKIMQRAGARDAILLDGGSSTGMAWKGKVIYNPSRQIAYGIGVFENYQGKRYSR